MKLKEVFDNSKKEFSTNNLYDEYNLITGIDEVGKGCVAGCVTVGLVTLDKDCLYIPEVTDSKKLSEKKREYLYDKIIDNCVEYQIISQSAEEIDRNGIDYSILTCMDIGISLLKRSPNMIIVDHISGFKIPNIKTISQPKADLNYYCVGASSIIAKVFRDRLMVELSKTYPDYLFENHKGYGTTKHIDMIKKIGRIDGVHRKSFRIKGIDYNII